MDGALGQCGRFTLELRIGAGGMGEIFLARDPDGEPYAIKRLLREGAKDPVFVGMFLDEARLVERMEHPNVCRVYEHGLDLDSHYFLVMEHLEGASLEEMISRRGALPVPEACRIVADVAAALDYAHRLEDDRGRPLGTVHRDVSPANVMVTLDGRVKLLDFGLAKARTQLMKTAPGLVKGKFGYLAPEQLSGAVDWRTDVFALGLCLYEAVVGKQLFGQKTAAATVGAIRAFEGPPTLTGTLEGATPRLDAVLARALAPKPSDRFESAAALRAGLADVVRELGQSVGPDAIARLVAPVVPSGGQTPGARPPGAAASELPAARGERLPWVALGIGALVFVAGLLGAWLVWTS